MPKFSSISPLPMLLWSYILLLHMLPTEHSFYFFIIELSVKGSDNLNVYGLSTRALKSMKDQTNGTGKEKKTDSRNYTSFNTTLLKKKN